MFDFSWGIISLQYIKSGITVSNRCKMRIHKFYH